MSRRFFTLSSNRERVMNLSHKALRFVIECVEYRLSWYEGELGRDDLDDDLRSDHANDASYLESLLTAMKDAEAAERPQ